MAVNTIEAKDVVIAIGDVTIGCWQSATITVTTQAKNTTCASSGGWEESRPGKKSWGLQLNMLERTKGASDTEYTIDDALAMQIAGQIPTISYKTDTADGKMYTGTGWINQSTKSSDQDSQESNGTVNFTGTGALVPADSADDTP